MELYNNFTPLCKGSYGQIFTAYSNSTGEKVALKRISKQTHIARIKTEIATGIELQNIKGVVKFRETFETANSHWLAFDFVDGSDLFTFLKTNNFQPVPEAHMKKLAHQLVKSLAAIHSKGIYHKDIKLENVMIDSSFEKVYFIDFGLCNTQNSLFGGKSADYSGSREYSCPEIICRKPFNPEKADVWSLGVTIFTLLYGVFPFCISPEQYRMIHQSGVHPPAHFPSSIKRSSEVIDLLKKMLALNENDRISMKEVVEHPWFKRRGIFSKAVPTSES